ncbi:hypothetical protein GUJ93_ZPchr0014g47673 [Zizania palustris]|uniref:Uncharacterized protein n=1 Tax=Zizania palustris TaxID=103762 RepID=A0A8J5TCZ8_ZIZPA|nr:hypothetical protein GUJ93_ZPchr0014g47673 [Zizania palustris]
MHSGRAMQQAGCARRDQRACMHMPGICAYVVTRWEARGTPTPAGRPGGLHTVCPRGSAASMYTEKFQRRKGAIGSAAPARL